MDTIVSNEETPLTPFDCLEWLGETGQQKFHIDLRSQRVGQAWMNALNRNDYEKLTGSLYDPFYADDWASVIRALRFLLDN